MKTVRKTALAEKTPTFQNKKQGLAGVYGALSDNAHRILAELPTSWDYRAALEKAQEYRAMVDAFPGGL